MHTLITICFALFLVLLPLGRAVNAEIPSVKEKEGNQKIDNQNPKEEMSIDELLGPKDNFPFLPDNHRDSGTGKFNSF